jgi:hypothetical protein
MYRKKADDILRSMSSSVFSNTPYSEPDNDCSPCNDTDWDWGGGNKAG